MSCVISLITSDVHETNVFVQAFDDDLTLTFRFSNDTSRTSSLCSRIVTYYNSSDGATDLFPDRESMRTAIKHTIDNVWKDCTTHPSIKLPDVIVQIDEVDDRLVWSISHESRYKDFLQSLRPSTTSHVSKTPSTYVSWTDLRFTYTLGGRSSAKLVELNGRKYAYKGMSFLLFLELGKDFEHEVATFYHEIDVVSKLPKHPSILGSPDFLVTTTSLLEHDPVRVCGALYPYLKADLQEHIDEAGSTVRISLHEKAKWAFQVTSALRAVHNANQYHMDLKPSNILLDHENNALLADWEQYGASRFFIAPEADGSWDVNRIDGILQYRRYKGPERKNSTAWPSWNAFPLWQKEFPQALEAAEVYVLGRTLWVLLQQLDTDDLIDGTSISWTEQADDIPQTWKGIVARCCNLEPMERPKLGDVEAFWDHASESGQQ